MGRFGNIILRRLGEGAISLLVLSVIAFFMSHLVGSPLQVLLPVDAPKSEFASLSRQLGLNRPLFEQYFIFLGHVLRGNLGQSIYFRTGVNQLIGAHFVNSLRLGGIAIVITVIIAVPVGMVGGVWRGRLVDRVIRFLSIVGQSVPSFLVAVVLLQIFAVQLLWFPASSLSGGVSSYVLPVATLVMFETPSIVRLIRSSVISELQESYVTMAEIKGLSWFRVARHVLPNAAGPALAYAGADFVRVFLTGTVVVETVFAYPGIGYLTYQSVLNRDFPVIQGLILVIGLLYVIVSLFVDLLQGYLDPRVGARGVAAAAA